jgi:hypothetical protein
MFNGDHCLFQVIPDISELLVNVCSKSSVTARDEHPDRFSFDVSSLTHWSLSCDPDDAVAVFWCVKAASAFPCSCAFAETAERGLVAHVIGPSSAVPAPLGILKMIFDESMWIPRRHQLNAKLCDSTRSGKKWKISRFSWTMLHFLV